MAREVGRLTALKVARAAVPGMYPDGHGLYLQVTSAGAKSWIYRYSMSGRAREMGLGSLNAISLAEARVKASECRRLRHEGVDPVEARKAARAQSALEAAKALTFKSAATAYIASHRAGWRNAKHAAQWESTLEAYAYPVFGALPVQSVDTALMLKALEPIWAIKPETASRVRGRVENILDWAKVRGFRQGENPARWRGHLDKLLPAPSKVRAVKHHAAMPYDDVPAFLARLRAREAVAARALEYTILTAARTSETLDATWDEINTADKVWTVPASRMKAGKEHRVPLSRRSLAIIEALRDTPSLSERLIFPSGRREKPLSDMAMTEVLRRMGHGNVTVHGFRSSFRDWAAERTSFPNEVVEMALAHVIGDKAEAAYRRGDLFEKRRRLMAEWEAFCATTKPAVRGAVVALKRKA
jgi:integrase